MSAAVHAAGCSFDEATGVWHLYSECPERHVIEHPGQPHGVHFLDKGTLDLGIGLPSATVTVISPDGQRQEFQPQIETFDSD